MGSIQGTYATYYIQQFLFDKCLESLGWLCEIIFTNVWILFSASMRKYAIAHKQIQKFE